jgi:ubiquinone/menaquinone biosynthesis C-methylase UbiE
MLNNELYYEPSCSHTATQRPMRRKGYMRLKRDTALKIHYFLDQWLPPFLRDRRWFMYLPMRLAFHEHAATYLDFKEKAFQMTEAEFREAYSRVSNVAFQRDTDLNNRSIVRILEEVRGPKVLEVGCGKGYLARLLLRETNHHLTVTDIVIQEAVRALPGLNVYEANLEDLPFDNLEFDTVICTHTLEHVRNLSKGITELRRIARRVLIIVPRQRPYKYTFDLHLNFFPYPHSLLSAFGKTPSEASCEDVDGDLLFIEDQERTSFRRETSSAIASSVV